MIDEETRYALHLSTGGIVFVMAFIGLDPSSPRQWLVWSVVLGSLLVTLLISALWLIRHGAWYQKHQFRLSRKKTHG